jgi:nitrite reductase/ring-hydroxylating ferredoxin subunit
VTRWSAGPVDAIGEGERKQVDCDGVDVWVFRTNGSFHAFENVCPHQGGPVCEGRLSGTLVWDEQAGRPAWVNDAAILICPWHGIEFSLETGRALGGIGLALRRRDVVQENGEVWILS